VNWKTLNENKKFLGFSYKRIEDQRFLLGKGRYVTNVHLPNLHYMGVLRSVYPHAYIKKVDVSDAVHQQGIVGALTGQDLTKLTKPIYQWYKLEGLRTANVYCLATNKVRYVGEPIAIVVGKDAYCVQDALEKIVVDYEPLKPVVSIEDATNPNSPLLYDEWGTNIMLEHAFSKGDVREAFQKADKIIEEKMSSHRYYAGPLETRCYVAQAVGDELFLWVSSQQPYQTRTVVSQTIGIPEHKITVFSTDLGGGFGAKQPTYPEESLVALCALKYKVPVTFIETRKENLVSMHQAREQVHHVKMALKNDGTILALQDTVLANLGAYLPTVGPGSVIIAAKYLPTLYRIRCYEYKVLGYATNKTPYGAYRGYGKDAANYVIERMMNIAARELNLDPVEIRIKNIISPKELPYRSVTGGIYDSGDYLACLKKALELINYEKKKELKSLKTTCRLGIGFSITLEPTGSHYPGSYMLGYEGATVRVEPSGKVTVHVASVSMGTGHETMVAQIVAEELGLRDLSDVTVIESDSRSGPVGFGSWASRTTITTGSAVALAARDVKKKILQVAARLLQEEEAQLDIKNGIIFVKTKPQKSITLEEVTHAAYTYYPQKVMEGVEPGLESTRFFMPTNIETAEGPEGRNTYGATANSAHAALVEVDEETGVVTVKRYVVVTDCGRIINPLIVEGQVIGGVVQGLGGVLYEENVYNADGQPLSTTFMDYIIPTSLESPKIEVYMKESPSPFNPLGAKGIGENPIEGVAATIVNAVEDALSEYNIKITSLPLTPSRVYELIKHAKRHKT